MHTTNANNKSYRHAIDCQIQKDQKIYYITHSTSYPLRPICETFSNIRKARKLDAGQFRYLIKEDQNKQTQYFWSTYINFPYELSSRLPPPLRDSPWSHWRGRSNLRLVFNQSHYLEYTPRVKHRLLANFPERVREGLLGATSNARALVVVMRCDGIEVMVWNGMVGR